MFFLIRRPSRAWLILSGALLAASAWPAELQQVKGHVPEAVAKGLAATGRLPAEQQLRLAIGLPLRNRPALTNLMQQLYDPSSPLFHKFLQPDQFTARFGPLDKDYQAVRDFATAHGLTVTGTHPNRMVLEVSGAAADVEKAFHVTLHAYPHPTEPRTFYAPDVEPTLDLDVPVLHIAGLNDFARPHPASLHARPITGPRDAKPNAGSEPGGLYVGLDFRAAYVPGVTLTGAGQSVGLVEFSTYYAADVSQYLALSSGGLANTSVTITPVGVDESINTTPDANGNVEVALDIDMAICMAPGLSSVLVYEAPNSQAGADALFNRIATDNLAGQVSCSWSGIDDSTIEQDLQEYATQGVSFFIASGDSGAYTSPYNPPSPPADSLYVTSVGGTTLSTASARGPWSSETTWSWFVSGAVTHTNASSGGITTYAIPSWQQGVSMLSNGGSSTYRNIPDVAMTADQIYVIGHQSGVSVGLEVGGTSAAAPLWAGFTALVNQQRAAAGLTNIGFLNPAIYPICQGANYGACFHDITTGNNTNFDSPNLFYAYPGYDLCTGWGSPTGSNLINALTPPADVLQITPDSGFTTTASAGGPVKPASQVFLLTNTGASALTWSLTGQAAWLSNSAVSGALAGNASTNVTVSLNTSIAAGMAAGVYTTNVVFQNTSDGVTQDRLFTLNLVGAQLVLNGGFELGSFADWTVTPDDQYNLVGSATSVAVITGYGANRTTSYVGSYYIHSGNYAAFLGEPGTNMVHLSQVLATVPGQDYLLSFWLANPGKVYSPPIPNQFQVSWNGTNIYSQTNLGIISFTNMQFVVLATGASTTLAFGATNQPDYFGLDDVSVTPISAPAFQSTAAAGGTISLTWSAMTGVTYQVQYTTNLSTINWINLGSPISATGGSISTSDVTTLGPQRFYRVVVAP
jgi:subtilase family serine protease